MSSIKSQGGGEIVTSSISSDKEKKMLILSSIGALVIGSVGITLAAISGSSAIMLDGLFNTSYFLAGLLTLRTLKLINKNEDQDYNFGYSYYEPLINGIKGMMILGITLLALYSAVVSIFRGGSNVETGPAILYGLFATSFCLILAIRSKKISTEIGSPLIAADMKNWMINAAISSAVLFTFITVSLIQGTIFSHLIPYIDSILVILIVILSIAVPIRMSYLALMELMDKAPSKQITKESRKIIDKQISILPVKDSFIRIKQPGRTRYILVHVLLPKDYGINKLSKLDDIRTNTLNELTKIHRPVILDMLFTTDDTFIKLED